MGERGKKYQRYLASREWAVRREAVRRRAYGHCERCEVLPMVAVHHLTYEHIYHEPLEDLQAICEPCHLYESGKIDIDPVDVRDWAFSSGFSRFAADGPMEDGDKERSERQWDEKYGPGWELDFIAFVLSWPEITNIIPLADRPSD